MILVTGASGFVGGHVARRLVEEGGMVRVLLRKSSSTATIEGLKVEKVAGDLTDPASLRQAVRGCEMVFHVAADYRLWVRNPGAMYAANVKGTANLLDAAAEAGVPRIVYTSTVGCMGWPANGRPASEDTPVALTDMVGHYKRSKFLAEQVALERARRGLPVVVVNPTAPVGEGDVKPTPTGRIVLDFLRGRMPAYIDTGLNLVDVRAVAQGHVAAACRGRIGERYLLGGRNMELKDILATLARLSGRRAPSFRLPWAVAYAAAAAENLMARVTGHEPLMPLDGVKMARHKMYVDSDKAARELGFEAGNPQDALGRAVAWFREHGYVN